MPYIKQSEREKFKLDILADQTVESPIDLLKQVAERSDNAGDLNYAITMILKNYLNKKGESYATHNELVGMMECCKQEWVRRRVSPYEERKILENGDV